MVHIRQYAYQGEQGLRIQATQLSHEQLQPTRHLRLPSGEQGHRSMLPPPPPIPGPDGRFRPMDTRTPKMLNTQTPAPQTAQQRPSPLIPRTQQRPFAVPQTPHRTSATSGTHFTGKTSGGHQTPSLQSNRFMPSSHGRSNSGTAAGTSSNVPGTSAGGHRMSFASGGTNGFG
jgi:hypothetical protein